MRLKIIWLSACAAAYIFWLISVGSFSNTSVPYAAEKGMYLTIFLATMGFPSVPVWYVCAALVLKGFEAFGILTPNGYVTDTVIWVGAVIVGYVQWFHVVPAFKRRRAQAIR